MFSRYVAVVGVIVTGLVTIAPASTKNTSLRISADRDTLPMGRTVVVTAVFEPERGCAADYILLPYVNQRRWGSHERPDSEGKARFLLPLPNIGPAQIQVVAVKSDTDNWQGLGDMNLLLVGRPMQKGGIRSNIVEVAVTWCAITAKGGGDTLFGVQWEPWFTRNVVLWQTSHAVPVVGLYESYNRDVTRQHILWFMYLGVDFIMPDWSNHIWGKTHWNQRGAATNTILHATALMLEVLASMRDEGLAVPKVALMPGLSNGPPATMEALNEQLEWIYHNYLRNPRFEGLWQKFDGKPLVVILDTAAMADKRAKTAASFQVPFFKQTLRRSAADLDARRAAETTQPNDRHFTIRWMSSQNQLTGHHKLGYWSWMDGVLKPPVTYRAGKAEAVTVTPAFFGPHGWTGAEAHGRRNGLTYVESFKVALEHRPQVVLLHQFNEFMGQRPGHGYGRNKSIYVDSYSVEFSDDLEPVSPTAAGYRGDRGGWGYYYLNLTQALMSIYRGVDRESTILAVDKPYIIGEAVSLRWSTAGKKPAAFRVTLDGTTLAEDIEEQSFRIPLSQVGQGKHTIRVTALGARTRYELSALRLDVPLAEPIGVAVEHVFTANLRQKTVGENAKLSPPVDKPNR